MPALPDGGSATRCFVPNGREPWPQTFRFPVPPTFIRLRPASSKVRKGLVLLTVVVGISMSMTAALLLEFAPVVSTWELHASHGTSPGAEMRAGQPYYLWGDAGCKDHARYPVSMDIVDLATGEVAGRADGVLSDSDGGCFVIGSLGEVRVPHDGRYVFQWTAGPDLASQGAVFKLKALALPLDGAIALCLSGIAVIFLWLPLALFSKSATSQAYRRARPSTKKENRHGPPVPRIVDEGAAPAPSSAPSPRPPEEP